jgi:phosphohistidine phosphatase
MPDEKVLYLMRHAESDWMHANRSDFERPLNNRGVSDAPRMGKRLKQRDVQPDILISSPARRTVQTTELLATELGLSPESVIFDENIYEASPEDLLEAIRAIKDCFSNVILIGHNPSITWLTRALTGEYIDSMPTAGIAAIRLLSGQWKDVGHCSAQLLDFDFPEKTESV